jgi:hypothetical protein
MTNNNDELELFLSFLKIHNKDLDACFNDAVAVSHLMKLVDHYAEQRATERVIAVLEALTFYERWNKVDELPAEIKRRIAQLKATQQK